MNNNIRIKAYEILYEVCFNNGYANLLLRQAYQNIDSVNDRNLLTNIVYGILKNKRLLEYQLNILNNVKISNKQLIILLIALYQYHFLDRIPSYAIISEAQKMSGYLLDNYQKKFINALLHQLLNEELVYAQSDNELNDLSINYSQPLWYLKMLKKQYGHDVMVEVIKDNNKPAKLYLRMNHLNKDKFIDNQNLYKKLDYLDDAYEYLGDNIIKDPNYLAGVFSIQDLAAQRVSRFLNPSENSSVLDMCAAPGTKTTHLADIMNNTGIIKAYDFYEHRIDLLKKEITRLNITNITAQTYDSLQLLKLEQANSFDYILCDAPCTGLGVIKRKPEIKFQDISKTMDEIIIIQQGLLEVAISLLKDNGCLVYSTCTLNKKENEFQIRTLLNNNDNLRLIDEKTIFSYEDDCDSFYMAKIIKNKAF
ncbi:MAG: 16S rRNA (cytosine(967)-C(5))-methyltransferase RsmB [Bacilli bacterium]|nr:16S rRNA (cytosine(967)-C(5))-methyltransferase RsmB [Bacilli bacterium]